MASDPRMNTTVPRIAASHTSCWGTETKPNSDLIMSLTLPGKSNKKTTIKQVKLKIVNELGLVDDCEGVDWQCVSLSRHASGGDKPGFHIDQVLSSSPLQGILSSGSTGEEFQALLSM